MYFFKILEFRKFHDYRHPMRFECTIRHKWINTVIENHRLYIQDFAQLPSKLRKVFARVLRISSVYLCNLTIK